MATSATGRTAPHDTTDELAERWRVSHRTIGREVRRGRLARIMVGKSARFAAGEVERYERDRAGDARATPRAGEESHVRRVEG